MLAQVHQETFKIKFVIALLITEREKKKPEIFMKRRLHLLASIRMNLKYKILEAFTSA